MVVQLFYCHKIKNSLLLTKWALFAYTSPALMVKIVAHENCINKVEVLSDYRVATYC